MVCFCFLLVCNTAVLLCHNSTPEAWRMSVLFVPKPMIELAFHFMSHVWRDSKPGVFLKFKLVSKEIRKIDLVIFSSYSSFKPVNLFTMNMISVGTYHTLLISIFELVKATLILFNIVLWSINFRHLYLRTFTYKGYGFNVGPYLSTTK